MGDILNAVDNVDDQEGYEFRGSYLKIAPAVIYDYTKINSEYATRKFETREKYWEYWQTIWWNISEKYDW